MYLLISIVFIAELIIAIALVSFLIKIDKKANAFTTQWIATEQDSIKLIKEFREILKTSQKVMSDAVDYVKKKKREFRRKLINLAIIYAILVIFKVKFRRAAVLLQYLIIAKDLWKSIPI